VYEPVDVEHTSSAKLLALELGMKVREEASVDSLALENDFGRVVFLDGTRTIVVAGTRLEAGERLEVRHGDVKLLTGDAFRVRAAWQEAVAEARTEEPAAPPAARGDRPRPGAAAAAADAAWKVPLRRTWEGILIHHSATDSGNLAKFDKFHREVNGWDMVGYDFIVCNGDGGRDGLVETTNRWKRQIQGAHAGKGLRRYNDHWVGICLVGDFNGSRPTRAQMASLRRLVAFLQEYCGIPDGNVRLHKDVRDTDCPGRRFPLREVLEDPPRAK
jgi:hypothetical protein